MKLANSFREQVRSLGKLKRAWFTTFNLNVPFFETHVLPALLDIDTPGSRLDFESIQLQMAGIDVRVFCDMRVMDADQLKRTAVQIHGLLPDWMELPSLGKQSLFHPKVILLEGEDRRMVLGAGSANLTVHGWARNEEVFAFRPIASNAQYQQVLRFFEPLAEAAGAASMAKDVRPKLHGTDKSWSFVHTFEKRSFLDQLLHEGGADNLSVWSPYFARDLAGLLEKIRVHHGEQLRFSLVPDRAGHKRVRTVWTDKLGDLIRGGTLAFHNPPSPRAKEIELTHAKVWLARGKTSARLAIGSWNCTTRGTASFEDRNVEAGFVFDVSSKAEEIVGKALLLNESHFSPPEQMDQDQPDLLELPPFELKVTFDWQSWRYSITGRLTDISSREGYSLRLPSVAEDLSLQWSDRPYKEAWTLKPVNPEVLEVLDDEPLLTNHSYEILHEGELVYRGLILEIHAEHRRPQGYDSLQDLLNDLVDDASPVDGTRVRLRRGLRGEMAEDEESTPETETAAAAQLSYFRVFQAFDKFRDRLRKAAKHELEMHLFVYPSSLQEMVKKVEERVRCTTSPVFQWILLEELKGLYAVAEACWDGRRSRPAKWCSLKSKLSVKLPSKISGNAEYMRQLRKLYRDEF